MSQNNLQHLLMYDNQNAKSKFTWALPKRIDKVTIYPVADLIKSCIGSTTAVGGLLYLRDGKTYALSLFA